MAANAWPGFVDILSAVVIMFVFFVLITAAVLYFYTITYTSKVEGQSEQVVESVEPQIASALEKVEALEQENQELREQLESSKPSTGGGSGNIEIESDQQDMAAQAFGEQTSDQAVLESDQDNSLVIFHDTGAITVDETTEARVEAFIEKIIRENGADNVEIVLTSPKKADAVTQSRAQRLAVARMLNVRNALLKSSINKKNLSLKVVESESIDESVDWTKMQVNILQ